METKFDDSSVNQATGYSSGGVVGSPGGFLSPRAFASHLNWAEKSIAVSTMKTKANNAVDKHVGRRIRMRRVMLAMTQTELGDGVGITFQQIQKYENGMNRVSASRLQQISQVLQAPPEFFFEGAPDQFNTDGKKPTADYVSEFLSTSDGLALARAFTRLLNAKLRRSVVALVEGIASQ